MIEENYILIGASLMGEEPTFNGTGILCQIEFTGMAVGSCILQFDTEETFLLDFDMEYIPHVTLDGVAQVYLPSVFGDVNGDGKVDMKDIAIVAKAFGTVPGDPRWNPEADINGDDKVDMKDIALIARNFGKT